MTANEIRGLAPGLLLAGTIALASAFISEQYGGPVMLYAILFGIAFNFLNSDGQCAAGIQFASKRILQLGVIMLGAAVTFDEIALLGWSTAGLVIAAVVATLTVGWAIARVSGLSRHHGIISAGSVAICGASAAMAVASILPQSKENERALILTVVGVTTLSTITMIVYPLLTSFFGLTDMRAGVFLGATIHDVAQVIGAGYIVSDEAGAVSAVVKLMRVTLLAPAALAIAMIFAQSNKGAGASQRAFPIFLLGFFALMAANSFGLVPDLVRGLFADISRWCLIIAVSALGVKTALKELMEMGPKPVIVLVLQTLFLAGFVALGIIVLSSSLPA